MIRKDSSNIKIKQVIIFFIFFALGLVHSLNAHAFAQGREYLRTRSGTLPAEAGTPSAGGAPLVKYFLAPDDELEVFVWQNPDLTKNVVVGPDGEISFPLVGRIKATGLTPEELEDKLKEKLAEYIKSPQITVSMRKYAGNKLVILGEVNYPGIYTYKGEMNLIDAIALSGDFTANAHMDSVILVRGEVNKNPEVKRIDMVKVITWGTTGKDIILEPNDVIFVPKTFVANLNKFIADIGPIIGVASSSLNMRQQVRKIAHHDDFSGATVSGP